jgi:ADP-heptose:LPS heptosyltransferase
VLFLRYGRIGDMVVSTGTIKAIACALPTITVDVLASELNAAVLSGNPHVDTVISIDKKRPLTYLKAIIRMRSARYDAVVDAMLLAPSLTTTLLMLCSGAQHRIGLAGRGNDSALTVPVTPIPGAVHYVDRSAALLTAFGLPVSMPDPLPSNSGSGLWQPELFLTVRELCAGELHWRCADSLAPGRSSRRRLVVNVSAGRRDRYWPERKFIAALVQLRTCYPDIQILIVGLPRDLDRMSWVGVGAAATVVRTRHYRQMMAIVAASDFVLTADTSVTHVASAFHKPVVVLFPGREEEGACWGPYGTSGKVVWAGGPFESLEVGAVVGALQELMSHHPMTVHVSLGDRRRSAVIDGVQTPPGAAEHILSS